jgi:hypothetical protein
VCQLTCAWHARCSARQLAQQKPTDRLDEAADARAVIRERDPKECYLMRKNTLLYVALILFGGACAESHAEQVRDARLSQADDHAKVREHTVEQQAKERDEVIKDRYDSLRQAAAQSDEPDADETENLLKLSQDRAQYQSKAQEQLDKLSVRIDAAQQKINVLGGRAPLALTTDLKTARQEHQTLEQEFIALRSVRSPNWESNKDRLEQRLSKLEGRVSRLSDDIENAAG